MYDLIIIGGGVSAYTAALYAGRRGLSVLVMAKDIGGQANYTDIIENYPGLEEVGGWQLVTKIKAQAERFGVKTIMAEVDKVKPASGSFVVSAYGKQYKSKGIVLAYGKTPQDLKVLGEQEFKGKGISYCATCDAPLYKKRPVAVVGIGDINLEAALVCAKYSSKVYLLSKTDKLVGHPALVKAVKQRKNIELVPFVRIESVTGTQVLEQLNLIDQRNNTKIRLKISGLFVELGYVVQSQFVQDLVKLDELGQVIVDAKGGTSAEGVFAAGDCTNRHYKQAVVSAGEGATAALAFYDWHMRRSGGSGLSSDWTQIKKLSKK